MQETQQTIMPAEWAPQKGVIIVWPHKTHDWQPILEPVSKSYIQMTQAITNHQPLYLVAYDEAHWQSIKDILSGFSFKHPIIPIIIKTNDTWTRDTGPISVLKNNELEYLDFAFNAWGGKCPYELDDKLCEQLATHEPFNQAKHTKFDFILEGGSIESDGKGTIMTTKSCLLNPNRNPHHIQTNIENLMLNTLGAKQILWLDVEPIEGDDTDGHIDTLARFCPNNTICYLKGDDDVSESLEAQLRQFKNGQGQSYQLAPLPYRPLKNKDDKNIPATYANFLIINEAVLVPQYGLKEDKIAMDIINQCFDGYTLYPIDALPFIEQGGSVHCLTMQVPV